MNIAFCPYRVFRQNGNPFRLLISGWWIRSLIRIAREGPLGAKDFLKMIAQKAPGWWDWRPSKVALEDFILRVNYWRPERRIFTSCTILLAISFLRLQIDNTYHRRYTRHLILDRWKRWALHIQRNFLEWQMGKPPRQAGNKKLSSKMVKSVMKVEELKAHCICCLCTKRKG